MTTRTFGNVTAIAATAHTGTASIEIDGIDCGTVTADSHHRTFTSICIDRMESREAWYRYGDVVETGSLSAMDCSDRVQAIRIAAALAIGDLTREQTAD